MVIAQKPITNSISDCVSISLAEESSWQRCADKLIAALPGIPKIRRPFIALLLPEKPEIANELASLESSRSSLHSKEWLKVIATDNTAVKNSNDAGAWTYLAIEKPATCRMKTTSATRPAPPFARTRTGNRSAPRDICP